MGGCHREARGGENAPALGLWVPGVTDIRVQQRISQASAQNTASRTGRGPANVSRCPVGSPFGHSSGQLRSRKFHTPRSLARALPTRGPPPNLPPAPGPLQLISDPKGTWALPKAQQKDVCVFRALEGMPGPTLTPHTMGQEEEVGFWVGLGSSWKDTSLQGCPGPVELAGTGQRGPRPAQRADVPSSDCGGRRTCGSLWTTPDPRRVRSTPSLPTYPGKALLCPRPCSHGAAAGPGLCTHLRHPPGAGPAQAAPRTPFRPPCSHTGFSHHHPSNHPHTFPRSPAGDTPSRGPGQPPRPSLSQLQSPVTLQTKEQVEAVPHNTTGLGGAGHTQRGKDRTGQQSKSTVGSLEVQPHRGRRGSWGAQQPWWPVHPLLATWCWGAVPVGTWSPGGRDPPAAQEWRGSGAHRPAGGAPMSPSDSPTTGWSGLQDFQGPHPCGPLDYAGWDTERT